MTRSQTPWRSIGIWLWQMFSGEYEQADAIVSGPVMLIGSYRSFPCVAPFITPVSGPAPVDHARTL